MFILFPDFYAIILGGIKRAAGIKNRGYPACEGGFKLVVVGICPFMPSWGLRQGQTSTPFFSPVRSFCFMVWKSFGAALALPVAILLGMKRGGHRFLSFHQQGVPHGAD